MEAMLLQLQLKQWKLGNSIRAGCLLNHLAVTPTPCRILPYLAIFETGISISKSYN
jgi:hypothetical protein